MEILSIHPRFGINLVCGLNCVSGSPRFLRLRSALLVTALTLLGFELLAPCIHAQTASRPPTKRMNPGSIQKIAAIKSFRIVQEKNGPAVEILSTSPLVPAIQLINDPTRLVIDLPNARLETQQKRISVQAGQISTLRADQFQQNPPVARIVVDLAAPREYTWDAAGNRLMVHLGNNPGEDAHSPFEAPQVASLKPPPQAVVKAVRASGPLAIASDAGDIGSSFTAGADTGVLRLSSGGELHVCPGTTVSITPSQSRHNLMLSMSTGALEAHMVLDASTDAVMTPDFRITLVGPGEFHYAFSADNQGNTCVRALPGNTSSAIVTELLGDRTFQVRAADQVVFRGGQLDRVDATVPLECVCPPPRQPMRQATDELPVQKPTTVAARPAISQPAPVDTSQSPSQPATGVPTSNAAAAAKTPSPTNKEIYIQVTEPLVFRATGPPPAPVEDAKVLPLDPKRESPPQQGSPAPPPAQEARPATNQTPRPAAAPEHRGFFRRVGGFFAHLFK